MTGENGKSSASILQRLTCLARFPEGLGSLEPDALVYGSPLGAADRAHFGVEPCQVLRRPQSGGGGNRPAVAINQEAWPGVRHRRLAGFPAVQCTTSGTVRMRVRVPGAQAPCTGVWVGPGTERRRST